MLFNVMFAQFLFQQLGVIIAIVKQHIRNYLHDIFELIKVGFRIALILSVLVPYFKMELRTHLQFHVE